ncbi:MAG: class I SAM-dependent methyltransferase [Chloroflexi bacterium]|nr:class I SAM-dependent methyltransferase [Chloroflexota bacterium]
MKGRPSPLAVRRRVPGAGKLAEALRPAWERVRPISLPRYLANTPQVGGRETLDAFFPPNASTLAAGAMSQETATFVSSVLERLTASEDTSRQPFFYAMGHAKFGGHWRNADILTALRAAAMFVRPSAYLEIGVRRARSAAIVAASCPQCAIYGFDLWLPEYGGAPNPGPEFVRAELQAIGHSGPVELVSGDSHETVPAFLRRHPDLFFDMITVDGDHSVQGAADDLANVLPRLKVGGIIVFDDVSVAPELQRVWRKVIGEDSRYASWQFTEAGAGVAIAARLSDQPPATPLYWYR